MNFGIATAGVVPMREACFKRSGLVTQLLFGELVEVEERGEGWSRVRAGDGTEGWVENGLVGEVGEEYVREYGARPKGVVDEVAGLVRKEGDWVSRVVVAGSVLPLYDAETGTFRIGTDRYWLESGTRKQSGESRQASVARNAFLYHNTPYLDGGRSPQGIDSAGLVQMAYRLAGVELPRSLERQVECGHALSFVEEAQVGDVAFFGDHSGIITHAGIVWTGGFVIHASGRVRVDRLDHNGIFSEEMKRYTHSLKLLKRFL